MPLKGIDIYLSRQEKLPIPQMVVAGSAAGKFTLISRYAQLPCSPLLLMRISTHPVHCCQVDFGSNHYFHSRFLARSGKHKWDDARHRPSFRAQKSSAQPPCFRLRLLVSASSPIPVRPLSRSPSPWRLNFANGSGTQAGRRTGAGTSL